MDKAKGQKRGKSSRNIPKRRVVFIMISLIIVIICLATLGGVIWAETGSGYKTLTSWAGDKSIDSWQVKLYYGLFKKYPYSPTFTSNQNPEEKTHEPDYKNTNIETEIIYTTDKQLYHSGEEIKLDLNIKSKKDLKDVNLYIYGIKNKYNDYAISETKTINLNKGDNNSEYKLTLPYCNSCSGVKEGDYTIFVRLIDGQTLVGKEDVQVSLRQ